MRAFFFLLITGTLITFMAGCQSQSIHSQQLTDTIHDPIFSNKPTLSTFDVNINRILNLINQPDLASARQQFALIGKTAKTSEQISLLAYTEAKLLVAEKNLDKAYDVLNNTRLAKHSPASNTHTQIYTGLLNIDILTKKGLLPEVVKSRITLAQLISDTNVYQINHESIWQTLNKLDLSDIQALQNNKPSSHLQGWIDLNLLYRNSQLSLDKNPRFLHDWHIKNPGHPATIKPINELNVLNLLHTATRERIAILLPFRGKYSSIGDAIKDGFIQAHFKNHAKADIHFYHVGENDQFLVSYNKAVAEGSTLIIGPLFKKQLEELYSQESLPVNTIALNKLNIQKKPARLFQFSMAPEDEILAITEHAKEEKRQNAFIIAQKNEHSQKNVTAFIHLWEQMGNHIITSHSFSDTTDLTIELEKKLNIDRSLARTSYLENLLDTSLEHTAKNRTDIDIVLLFSNTENAQDINPLLKPYLANNIAIYSTSAIYRGFPNSQIDQDLNDIIFTDIPLVIDSHVNVPNEYSSSPLIRMYAFGIDTFQISEKLPLMIKNSGFEFNGATGKLSLNNGDFTRIPVLGMFTNGKVQTIPSITQQP